MKKKDIFISLIVLILLLILINVLPGGRFNKDLNLYYELWNALRGNGSLIYSVNSGLEIFSSFLYNHILLPFNLLIGLSSKSNIFNMLVYIYILRFIITYVFSYLVVDKLFDSKLYKYLVLVVYLLLSYFIDIIILLDISIILYSFIKKNGYLFSIGICLLMIYSFNNWYIYLIGIILFSSLYIIYKKDKLFNLVYVFSFSLLGLVLSSFILLPGLVELNDKIVSDVKVNNSTIEGEYINNGYRYVNMYGLNDNFNYILDIPSISNGNVFIDDNILSLESAFGLGGTNVNIGSYGGTLFTDLILMNRYFFTGVELNNNLYNLLDKKDDMYLYESKYYLDYVIPFNGEIFNSDNGSFIDNNNSIYKLLFNREDNIINEVNVKHYNDIYTFDVKKGREYYIYVTPIAYENFNVDFSNIDVNIKAIYFNNNDGFITYKIIFDTDKDLKITLNKDFMIEDILVGYVDIDDYVDFVSNIDRLDTKYSYDGRVINYKFNNIKDDYVLLPINYSNNFVITNNGEYIKYDKNIYNLVSIKINKGENNIKIKYVLPFGNVGIILSISSLIVLILLFIFRKKFMVWI